MKTIYPVKVYTTRGGEVVRVKNFVNCRRSVEFAFRCERAGLVAVACAPVTAWQQAGYVGAGGAR